MKKWLRLPSSITPETLEAISTMASSGLTKTHICTKLKLNKNTFGKYRECAEAYASGRVDLAQKVAQSFKGAIGSSYSDRVHISKALRLFENSIEHDEIVDLESAQAALASAIKAFTAGEISENSLEAVRKSVISYSENILNTEIAQRLQKLEEIIGGR